VPFIKMLPPSVELIAITNDPASPLASHASQVLPLIAGTEVSVATKTYLNSMACLWLLTQYWHSGHANCEVFLQIADQIEQQLSSTALESLQSAKRLFFLGHGPHISTARQSAMMLGEWAKYPSIGTSIGAFRHGLIEIVDAETGIVLFGSSGTTHESTQSLADELRSYGAQVISIVRYWMSSRRKFSLRAWHGI
jgi:glucosamine--fructose-6-phosphate aminotransferase (isomerizing)